MPCVIHICDAVGKEMHLETSLEKVLTGIAYAIFGGYSADIYVSSVHKLENFAERLVCIVYAFKTGILFDILVATLVKGEFFPYIWHEFFMYLASAGSGNAMWRPYASLILE